MKTTTVVCGALAIILTLGYQARAQSSLTNGLVAYYPFAGNANDESGNGNDGSVYGAVLTTNRFGEANRAYVFNGSSYIEMTNSLPDMASASFSVWINVPGYGNAGNYIFMDGDETPGADFQASFGDGAQVGFAIKDNASILASLPGTNMWLQVIGVANGGTNLLKLFINGQPSGTSPSLGNANVGYHSRLDIGCRAVYHNGRFTGAMSDLRFYNRALSDSEVQSLYAFESASQCEPYSATAAVALDNGFVVGASVIDGGCGYTNPPAVRIIGGGGTGAQAVALVTNGFVVAVKVVDAGSGYTNTPDIIIAPPFCEPYFATATVTLDNGFVTSASVIDGGCGYTNVPTVRVIGGGGTGAQAVALVTNGIVVAVNVVDAGSGYTGAPLIVIAPPFVPQPMLSIAPLPVIAGSTSQLFQLVFGSLSPYDSYQLEFTSAVGGPWTNFALPFVATSAASTQDVIATGITGFFRARHIP